MKNLNMIISLLFLFAIFSHGIAQDSDALRKQDSLALVAIYKNTGGENWKKKWPLANDYVPPMNRWIGVSLKKGRVYWFEIYNQNIVGDMPSDIKALDKVGSWKINQNKITSLPPEIGFMKSMTELRAGDNKLKKLPAEIGQLSALSILDLYKNELTELPSEIGNLRSLRTLTLSNNKLSSLPAEFIKLKTLAFLSLDKNQLTELPDMSGFTNVTNLNLNINKIKVLPSSIGKMSRLTKLKIQGNLIEKLPNTIGDIPYLKELVAQNNKLKTLPESIGNLKMLTSLALSNNELESLPASIGKMEKLKSLMLNGNNLKELPKEIGNLPKLWSINLTGNKLKTLPAELANLPKLSFLRIQNNEITSLPAGLEKLNLSEINLANNRLGFQYIELFIEAGIKKVFFKPQKSVGEKQNILVSKGASVTLDSKVGGKSSWYQWKKDGKNIGGKTKNATLKIASATSADAGIYTCEVTSDIVKGLTLVTSSITVGLKGGSGSTTNKPPVKIQNFSPVTINEGTKDNKVIDNIRNYFSDPEGSSLVYNIKSDNSRVIAKITGYSVVLSSTIGFNGDTKITITAADSKNATTNADIKVNVVPPKKMGNVLTNDYNYDKVDDNSTTSTSTTTATNTAFNGTLKLNGADVKIQDGKPSGKWMKGKVEEEATITLGKSKIPIKEASEILFDKENGFVIKATVKETTPISVKGGSIMLKANKPVEMYKDRIKRAFLDENTDIETPVGAIPCKARNNTTYDVEFSLTGSLTSAYLSVGHPFVIDEQENEFAEGSKVFFIGEKLKKAALTQNIKLEIANYNFTIQGKNANLISFELRNDGYMSFFRITDDHTITVDNQELPLMAGSKVEVEKYGNTYAFKKVKLGEPMTVRVVKKGKVKEVRAKAGRNIKIKNGKIVKA